MKRPVYSERVFAALVIQQVLCTRRIVICGVSGSTIFFTLSYKRHDFRENVIQHKTCVLIFSTVCI